MNLKKLAKFYQEWKWALILLAICIAGIPLTTIYGIQSVNWGNDFWPNALSEFLGMFVELIFGAIFSFVVIDKYLQYHRNVQWRKIKNLTYRNLYFILSNILLKLNLSFPKEMRVGAYILTEDIETLNDYLPKEDFDIFATAIGQYIDKIIQECDSDGILARDKSASFVDEEIHSALAKFKQHTKSDITSVSSLVIPKLLNFSDDPVLLDNVIELEELFTSLMSKINNVHRRNKIGNEENSKSNEVKFIWLIKIQEILTRIKAIADSIENDIDID